MNDFENVGGLDRDSRQLANLQTYSRFLGKCEDPYDMLDKDVKADVKDILKGKGKLVAVAQSGRALSGAPRYVLFVDVKDGVKFYSYTKLNKLYNEFGPFKDLETALSNADCYGLFEEGKKNMNKKLFEEINGEYDPYDDDLGYGPDGMGVYDGEMEDASDSTWNDYDVQTAISDTMPTHEYLPEDDKITQEDFDAEKKNAGRWTTRWDDKWTSNSHWDDSYDDGKNVKGMSVNLERGVKDNTGIDVIRKNPHYRDRVNGSYVGDTIKTRPKGSEEFDGERIPRWKQDADEYSLRGLDNPGPELVDYDPFEESKKALFDEIING